MLSANKKVSRTDVLNTAMPVKSGDGKALDKKEEKTSIKSDLSTAAIYPPFDPFGIAVQTVTIPLKADNSAAIRNAALSPEGKNTLPTEEAEHLKCDLSDILEVAVADLSGHGIKDKVLIDKNTILIDKQYAQNCSDFDLRTKVAEYLANAIFSNFQNLLASGKLNDENLDNFTSNAYQLISKGFYDDRLITLINLANNYKDNAADVKVLFNVLLKEGYFKSAAVSEKAKKFTIENFLKSYVELLKNKALNNSNSWAELARKEGFWADALDWLKIEEDIDLTKIDLIKKNDPGLYADIEKKYGQMNKERILKAASKKLNIRLPASDVAGRVKLDAEMSYFRSNGISTKELEGVMERYAPEFPDDIQQSLDKLYLIIEDPFKISIAKDNAPEILNRIFKWFLSENNPFVLQNAALNISNLVDYFSTQRVIDGDKANDLRLKILYPSLNDAQLNQFNKYLKLKNDGGDKNALEEMKKTMIADIRNSLTARGSKNNEDLLNLYNCVRFMLNSDVTTLYEYLQMLYKSSGKHFTPDEMKKKELDDMGEELYDLQGRISNDTRISEKQAVEAKNIFNILECAIKSGDKITVRQTLDKIDAFYRQEYLRQVGFDDRSTHYDKLINKYLTKSLGLNHVNFIDNIISNMSSSYSIISNLEYASLTPAEKEKRRKKDDIGSVGQLFASAVEIVGDIKDLSMSNIKNTLRIRLRGITGTSGPSQKTDKGITLLNSLFLYKNYLTPERTALIKRCSEKYNVLPELVAARIIFQQSVVNYVYDQFDYLGGIIGNNTTIGLGQIKISNARKLFPERFSGKSDAQITIALKNEEINIECIAKYFSTIQEEGKVLLGSEPTIRELGSRYTSSDYYSAVDDGISTEEIFREIQILDPFNSGQSKVALTEYYKLVDEIDEKR